MQVFLWLLLTIVGSRITTASDIVEVVRSQCSINITSQEACSESGDASLYIQNRSDSGYSSASVHSGNLSSQLLLKDFHSDTLECGLWLAPSTIPGAGLGVFAGRHYRNGDAFENSIGDLSIPLIDLEFHNKAEQPQQTFYSLWNEYTWNGSPLQAGSEGYFGVTVASTGIGSIPNCFLPLLNVDEWNDKYLDDGLHRSKDPGAGSRSPFGNRIASAKRNIEPGEELFVGYGEHWFLARDHMKYVPLTNDLNRATELFQNLTQIRNASNVTDQILSEVWEQFVQKNPDFHTSREAARLWGSFNHSDADELRHLLDGKSMSEIRLEQSQRSLEWLQQNGVCGDHLEHSRSTLDQAGLGAFASRNLPQGTIVTTLPLVHVPNRSIFDMYKIMKKGSDPRPHRSAGVHGYQIMLNYCFGHRLSTLLLCPYGPQASYINHNQSQANVKVVWGNPSRGKHQPFYLEQAVESLHTIKSAVLAMDLLAIRDIQEGEEIFLDYGDEWEENWNRHLEQWKPVKGAKYYVNANTLNSVNKSTPLMTEFAQFKRGKRRVFQNVNLYCKATFASTNWKDYYPDRLLELSPPPHAQQPLLYDCDVLRFRFDEVHKTYLYTAVARTIGIKDGKREPLAVKLIDIPREAFVYKDRPYTSDLFLKNAFRHDLRIPDEIFPESWKNLA